MSTASIQTQMGYAAQASPVTAQLPTAQNRTVSEPVSTPHDESRTTRHLPTPAETGFEKETAQKTNSESLQRVTRKTDVDWQTNELVYRMIDSRSGQVVSQSPDEALLRLRAYAKQALTQAAAEQAQPQSVSREL